MARKPRSLVFDSWALMAYLGDETAGQEVADLLTHAHENRVPMQMSIVNAGEVWYIIGREISESKADSAIADIQALGIQFIDADWSLTRIAGTFKARYKMSYADCYAAALAKHRNSELVTGDKEFKQVEGEVSVRWL
jgi:predicted nucleic acid-binding protein